MIDWIVIIAAIILGCALGMAVMFFWNRKQGTQNSVKQVEQRLNDYQNKVENHFSKTADLIDSLTESYQAVFTHLADSAEDLLSDEQIRNQLINRRAREVTIKYLKGSDHEDDEVTHINPPHN